MDTKKAGKMGGDKTKAINSPDYYKKIRAMRKRYPKLKVVKKDKNYNGKEK